VRSAFQVMSAMTARSAQRLEDMFYAMIGSITTDAPEEPDDLAVPAAEYFMRVCERKGDFSFIFTAAQRADNEIVGWRPLVGPMPAIFPWAGVGAGQRGEMHPAVLRLHDMHRTRPGSMSAVAQRFINQALHALGVASSSEDIAGSILQSLRIAGFTGEGGAIELEDGYFFGQRPPGVVERPAVLLSTSIVWPFGSPALLVREDGDTNHVVDVGVYIGPVPAIGESVDLI
jgi:hypothetical protein